MTGLAFAVAAMLGICALALARQLARNRQLTIEVAAILDPDGEQRAEWAPSEPIAALRRLALATIAEAEESEALIRRLQRALAEVPHGVVLCHTDGTILYSNPVADRFTGGRHGEALVEAAMRRVVARAAEGQSAHEEVELYGPPNRFLVVSGRAGHPASRSVSSDPWIVLLIEDVSERHRLEVMRRDFVSNIAHELRTPIGAMALLAETLLDEPDPANRSVLAERVMVEAERVAGTIEDLQALSRIEGDVHDELEILEVRPLVLSAVERIRPASEQRDIRLDVGDIDPHLHVFGDRLQLVSAVFNLLDNAVKYSDSGGTVETQVEHDEVEDLIEIRIVDHGVGIRTADLSRIFERFFRVDEGRSRTTGGTGLGLSIVRHIVVNHDGEIRVESELGQGSRFTLCLPAALAEAAPHDSVAMMAEAR